MGLSERKSNAVNVDNCAREREINRDKERENKNMKSVKIIFIFMRKSSEKMEKNRHGGCVDKAKTHKKRDETKQ